MFKRILIRAIRVPPLAARVYAGGLQAAQHSATNADLRPCLGRLLRSMPEAATPAAVLGQAGTGCPSVEDCY